MGDNSRILVVLSGGLDSTTLAYHLEAQGWRVSAVSFDYGQNHAQQEIKCAQLHSAGMGWGHQVIDMKFLGDFLQSSLTSSPDDVPEGHYADENMKKTIVPNRNAIMLSIATGIAVSHNIPYVATAVHAGDHPIYPDCRSDFIVALSAAFAMGNEGFSGINAPFLHWDKNEIAQRAVDLDVNINGTYSCYKGGPKHCGRCGTCVERMEAIWSTTLHNDIPNDTSRSYHLFPPHLYADSTFWMKALEDAK